MDKYTNNEIIIMLNSLTKQVKDGFKGVHDRQDKTNGSVKDNSEFRLKAQGSINSLKWIIGIVGVGNIAVIIKLFS